MMRDQLIVLNWKMNVPKERIAPLIGCIAKGIHRISKRAHVIVCPSHELIGHTSDLIRDSDSPRILIGAQNCSGSLWGAHTGEVSPYSLKRLGCSFVIVGHSERRMSGCELDAAIAAKTNLLLGSRTLPRPILCIGEQAKMASDARAAAFLARQLESALKKITVNKDGLRRLIVAYEPVWAIGTGVPVSLPIWNRRRDQISQLIKRCIGIDAPILYGGSVTEKNVNDFLSSPSGGVLVGGAGQHIQSLSHLLKVV